MKPRWTFAGLAVLLVAVGTSGEVSKAASEPYSVEELGPSGAAAALALNASALTVGRSELDSGLIGFVQSSGHTPFTIGTLGGNDLVATGVNESGRVVGYGNTETGGPSRAFVYDIASNSLTALDADALFASAAAVNDAGAIAGSSFIDGATRAVVWQGGTRTVLPSLGGVLTNAFAINSAGVVTGGSYTPDFVLKAFTWAGGASLTELASLGGPYSVGYGINTVGDVVGTSTLASGAKRAAWWPGGGSPLDLGTFGGDEAGAYGINDHNQIVGYATNAAGEWRAFLHEHNTLIDLNTLLPDNSGWVLMAAYGINASGQIVGAGLYQGKQRGFLLTPPASDADTAAPVIASVSASPNRIWPPQHQMVDVTVTVNAADDSGVDPSCKVTGVASSDPANGKADGNTPDDVKLVGDLQVQVRAERAGNNARTYTIAVECTDGAGNASTAATTVVVAR